MRKVFIRQETDFLEYALYDGNKLCRFDRLNEDFFSGSIVLGKVRFVKKNVGVFVDVGMKKDGILSYRTGIEPGDFVVVQIKTEPSEERGCSLTEKLTLPGKYLVYTTVDEYNFSHEIPEDKKIAFFSVPRPKKGGFVFRSLAKDAPLDAVIEEAARLEKCFEDIVSSAENCYTIKFLYRETALQLAENLAEEVVCGFDSIQKDIATLSQRKVETQGVELVFDKTEGATVVDVNFHTFRTTDKNPILQADLIAIEEFARQIRLRNIGGIILFDYISVTTKEDSDFLFEKMKECLTGDFARTTCEQAERAGCFLITRNAR